MAPGKRCNRCAANPANAHREMAWSLIISFHGTSNSGCRSVAPAACKTRCACSKLSQGVETSRSGLKAGILRKANNASPMALEVSQFGSYVGSSTPKLGASRRELAAPAT